MKDDLKVLNSTGNEVEVSNVLEGIYCNSCGGFSAFETDYLTIEKNDGDDYLIYTNIRCYACQSTDIYSQISETEAVKVVGNMRLFVDQECKEHIKIIKNDEEAVEMIVNEIDSGLDLPLDEWFILDKRDVIDGDNFIKVVKGEERLSFHGQDIGFRTVNWIKYCYC